MAALRIAVSAVNKAITIAPRWAASVVALTQSGRVKAAHSTNTIAIRTKATREARTPKLKIATAISASAEAAAAKLGNSVYSKATIKRTTPAGRPPAIAKTRAGIRGVIRALLYLWSAERWLAHRMGAALSVVQLRP